MSARRRFDVTKEEAELLRDSLQFWQAQLSDGLASAAHKYAGRNVFRRCAALILRLDEVIAKDDTA